MSFEQIVCELCRHQTDEEMEFRQALHGRRVASFKFRRQHTVGGHILDFYCADAKLDIEFDGFQHGLPDGIQRDEARGKFLTGQGIETLHFWNHQWRKNREGCLLKIWNAVQRRTGCVLLVQDAGEQRFVPPQPDKVKLMEKTTNPSPRPSPRLAGRGS